MNILDKFNDFTDSNYSQTDFIIKEKRNEILDFCIKNQYLSKARLSDFNRNIREVTLCFDVLWIFFAFLAIAVPSLLPTIIIGILAFFIFLLRLGYIAFVWVSKLNKFVKLYLEERTLDKTMDNIKESLEKTLKDVDTEGWLILIGNVIKNTKDSEVKKQLSTMRKSLISVLDNIDNDDRIPSFDTSIIQVMSAVQKYNKINSKDYASQELKNNIINLINKLTILFESQNRRLTEEDVIGLTADIEGIDNFLNSRTL